MKFQSLVILCTFFNIIAYSQKEYKILSKKVATADSVWIVNYALYDSVSNIRNVIKEGHVDSVKPKAIFHLKSQEKSAFITILERVNEFTGRYATQKGFSPMQAVLVWNRGHYLYWEFSLRCHDILAGPGLGFEWLNIDPIKANELDEFFRKIGLIHSPEIIK